MSCCVSVGAAAVAALPLGETVVKLASAEGAACNAPIMDLMLCVVSDAETAVAATIGE